MPMYILQNKPGSVSIGEVFIKNRDAGATDKNVVKKLISTANSADLLIIFKHYSVYVEEYSGKSICPLPGHANERTPSFKYYKDTNSFYCFGCRNGGGPANFVSLMDKLSRVEAARKIINNFYIDPNIVIREPVNIAEKQNILLEFSGMIRDFILSKPDDKCALEYAEKVCLIFDTINLRHNLDNMGVKSLINKLKLKIEQYTTL